MKDTLHRLFSSSIGQGMVIFIGLAIIAVLTKNLPRFITAWIAFGFGLFYVGWDEHRREKNNAN